MFIGQILIFSRLKCSSKSFVNILRSCTKNMGKEFEDYEISDSGRYAK